jgi:hypothetical protein
MRGSQNRKKSARLDGGLETEASTVAVTVADGERKSDDVVDRKDAPDDVAGKSDLETTEAVTVAATAAATETPAKFQREAKMFDYADDDYDYDVDVAGAGGGENVDEASVDDRLKNLFRAQIL